LLLFWSSKKVKENRLAQQGDWLVEEHQPKVIDGGSPTNGEDFDGCFVCVTPTVFLQVLFRVCLLPYHPYGV
jgi:hypothetical protein